MSFHVGQIFGDYSITAQLGADGLGRVYKVEHGLTKRTELMKVLVAEMATDTQVKRFEREMRALARLNHPNIAALHNAIHSEDQLILLTEYIEGQTLESVFRAGRLPLETGIDYIKQMLSALGYAHQQGIVHRDVTPANVLVTSAGEVKLTDFGLSKSYGDSNLTTCGEVLGSLPYLAPEQLKGVTQPDRRSDLYSVGAILYEHLTGQKPFGPNRRLAPVITDSEPEPQAPSQIEPALSSQWDGILRRALTRDPALRFQSAEEFLQAIAAFDQRTRVADLPLPQLRTLGWGIAIVATLMLALVASPALFRLRPAPPTLRAPLSLHIAAPAFATVKTPLDTETPAAKAPPAKVPPVHLTAARHSKRSPSVPFAEQAPPASHPVAVTSRPVLPAPLIKAATPVPAASPAPAPTVASPAPPVSQPVTADAPEAPAVSDTPPAKKGFWRKLNPFKKHNSEQQQEQQQQQ
jgi:serine/threonine-protein kinase